MKKEMADTILKDVKATYAYIAEEFDASRKELWKGFDDFLRYVKERDSVLDAGCGNGRLVKLFDGKNIAYTGCDNNLEFIKIAKKNNPGNNFILGDLMNMPFQGESFDVVLCIAAFHHIPSQPYRRQAILELKRILKKNGILIMTNWDRYTFHFLPYIIKATLLKIFGISKLDFKDIYVPWKNKAQRYYHCFTLRELKRYFQKEGLHIIVARRVWQKSSRNLVVIAQKK